MSIKRAHPPVLIRGYKAGDLDACRALWLELTEWHRYIYSSPGIGGSDPGRYFDEHLERVGPEHIWVAEVEGRVVGLTGLILAQGEAELEPLIVSSSYRGMGIGKQLTLAVISAAQKQGAPQLKVRPVARNSATIQFFYSLGFNILGHIELFVDFKPPDHQVWKAGEQIAGMEFKV